MKKTNENGITLIALVITIIVLIILAGITLNLLIGDNGILTRAKDAAKIQKQVEYKESLEFLILEEHMDRANVQTIDKAFISSLKERIENQNFEWVNGSIIMCDDMLIEHTNTSPDSEEQNTLLLIQTKDGYEIRIRVDNSKQEAQIESIEVANNEEWEIRYDANGGSGTILNTAPTKIRKGFSIKLPENSFIAPTMNTFVGWSTKSSGMKNGEEERLTPGSLLKIEENTTLYAIWRQNTSTISFNSNGGSGNMDAQTVENDVETELSLNTYIAPVNSKFIGWSTSENGEVEYTNGQKVTLNNQSLTLYAKWQTLYTITYESNGGTGTMLPKANLEAGETVNLDANQFTRTDYTFIGWKNGENTYNDGAEITIENSNITLVAQWDYNYSEANISALCEESSENIASKLADTTYRTGLFNSTTFYEEAVAAGRNSNIISVLNSNATYKNELSTKLTNLTNAGAWNEDLNTISYWVGKKCALIYNGNECEDITGTWISEKHDSGFIDEPTYKAATINRGNFYLEGYVSNTNSREEKRYSSSLLPTNKIDYSNYTSLTIKYKGKLDTYNLGSYISLSSGKGGDETFDDNGGCLVYSEEVSTTTKTFNISSITNSDYIFVYFEVDPYSFGGYAECQIYEWWLE